MNTEAQPLPDLAALKAKMKAVWSAGDFGRIAESIQQGAVEFVDRLDLKHGDRVLDVACGTGNTALPSAHKGAMVTGIDIAPNLIEQAKARAAADGVAITFEEGDAEALPYADGSFDTVITMFGAMFAPRPEKTAAELIRVCRSGGRIVMANWTPQSFTGLMFKTGAKHVPPPPGVPAPVLWGDEDSVKERLNEGISELRMVRTPITFNFPFGPEEVVDFFREYFGPTKMAFAALDANGQAALKKDLVDLWTEHNHASDGTSDVESEYLEVTAVRAEGRGDLV